MGEATGRNCCLGTVWGLITRWWVIALCITWFIYSVIIVILMLLLLILLLLLFSLSVLLNCLYLNPWGLTFFQFSLHTTGGSISKLLAGLTTTLYMCAMHIYPQNNNIKKYKFYVYCMNLTCFFFFSYGILAILANHKMWYTVSSFVSFRRQSMILYMKNNVLQIVRKGTRIT